MNERTDKLIGEWITAILGGVLVLIVLTLLAGCVHVEWVPSGGEVQADGSTPTILLSHMELGLYWSRGRWLYLSLVPVECEGCWE